MTMWETELKVVSEGVDCFWIARILRFDSVKILLLHHASTHDKLVTCPNR